MYDCSNGLEALAAVGDDYMYKLSWLVCEVRRHGYELKQIDQKIKDAVKDELSDERVQSIVEDIISNLSGIINVKTPPDELKPAVGDGSENDGEALQAIIDYAGQHGAAVYFPSGDYLTGPLTVPHDVSLYGYDRYQTRLVLAGGAETPMLEINGMGHTIQGITLDGNAANQVNEVVTLKVSGADILLTQLVIDNSYVGLDFSGTNGHLQMTDIIFGSMTAMAALIVGDVKVQAEQLIFNSLSAIKGEYVIEIGANRGSYQFASVATCETCLNLTGNDNHIEMDCINAANDYQDTGLRNTIYVYGKSEKVQLSGDKDVTVRGSQSINVDGSSSTNVGLNESTVVQGNRNLGVIGTNTESYTGNSTEDYSGNRVSNVKGNRNLGVIGTNTESYTGNSTEDYSGNRVSNVKGKDTLNARDLFLNPVNPLTYRQPTFPSKFYGVVPFKDPYNNEFNLLVETADTTNIGEDKTLRGSQPVNVLTLGVKNDGSEDIGPIVNEATKTMSLFFPAGEYRIDTPLELYYGIFGVMKDTQWFTGGSTVFVSKLNVSTWAKGQAVIILPEDSYSVVIKGILIKCNTNESAIYDVSHNVTHIENVVVYNVGNNASGIYIDHAGTRAAYFNNVMIEGKPSWRNNTGLFLDRGTDFRLTNVSIFGFRCCINAGDSYVYGANLHLWCGGDFTMSNYSAFNTTRCIQMTGGGIFIASNLYLDTSHYGFVTEANSIVAVTNLTLYDGSPGNTPDITNTGILFSTQCRNSVQGMFARPGKVYGNMFANPVYGNGFLVYEDAAESTAAGYGGRFPSLGYCNKKWTQSVSTAINNQFYEVARIYNSFGIQEADIWDNSGRTTHVTINGNTVTRKAGATDMPIYTKVTNDCLVLYTQGVAASATTTVNLTRWIFNSIVDYNAAMNTNGTMYTPFKQATAAGLKVINPDPEPDPSPANQ